MRRWFACAILLIAACFVVGWTLVSLSGSPGARSGGERVMWQVGGLMVYASVACALLCLVAGVVALAVEHVVARHRPQR